MIRAGGWVLGDHGWELPSEVAEHRGAQGGVADLLETLTGTRPASVTITEPGEVTDGDGVDQLGGGADLPEDDTVEDDDAAVAEWPRHKGRGTYELSDGSKVSGREEAHAAQAELNEQGDESWPS